jgi:hypothetical protein
MRRMPIPKRSHDLFAGKDVRIAPADDLHLCMLADREDFKNGHIPGLRIVSPYFILIYDVALHISANEHFFDLSVHTERSSV